MWYSAVYYNEWMYLVPGVLWSTVRQSAVQRFVDVARVLPLVVYLLHAAHTGVYGGAPLLWFVTSFVVLNMAMMRADAASTRTFNGGVYVVAHLSVCTWLFGLGIGRGVARGAVCTINAVSCLVLVTTLLLAVPAMQAWECYDTRDVRAYVHGYCPQYTGNYDANRACSATIQKDTVYCDPKSYEEYTPLHDVVQLEGHVGAHALFTSGVLYFTQIIRRTQQARLAACHALASKNA